MKMRISFSAAFKHISPSEVAECKVAKKVPSKDQIACWDSLANSYVLCAEADAVPLKFLESAMHYIENQFSEYFSIYFTKVGYFSSDDTKYKNSSLVNMAYDPSTRIKAIN